MAEIKQQLTEELGPDGVVGTEQLRGRATSYWDSSPTQARCLLLPQSTEQLANVMRICHEHGQSVVMQGGLTGIVEGALSTANDIIISLERMSEIVLPGFDTSEVIAIRPDGTRSGVPPGKIPSFHVVFFLEAINQFLLRIRCLWIPPAGLHLVAKRIRHA